MRPRTVDDGELLDLLLDAFADLGFEGTSVRALCRHLGVSHNMIHQRYQSKDQAWYAALDHAFEALNAELLAPPATDDPIEALREVMLRFARATVAKPALARIIHQEAARPGPRFDYMFGTYMLPIQQVVGQALEDLQKEGVVRPGPVSLAFLFTTTWGLGGLVASRAVAESVVGAEVDLMVAAELTVDVIIDGLRA